MPVIARDTVAADHLVYAWPFPIGPEEHEVACAEDELVVMCPSWMVGDRLGPGRHRWRTPDPMRPVSAYFVLTAPVEVSFDMITQFVIPTTGHPVRLRAAGSLQVRCVDPSLLVAQFVGLPFDHVNDGVLRSVSRSVERMLARLLIRRVVMSGTPAAVIDPAMMPGIVEELVAYNPAAGAVFGVELVRIGHLSIGADDGSRPWQHMTSTDFSGSHRVPTNGDTSHSSPHVQLPPSRPDIPLLETVRAPMTGTRPDTPTQPPPVPRRNPSTPPPIPPAAKARAQGATGGDGRPSEASGEIVPKKKTTAPGHAAAPSGTPTPPAMAAASPPAPPPDPHRVITTPVPPPRRAGALEVPSSTDEPTQPGVDIVRGIGTAAIEEAKKREDGGPAPEARGSILGIGMGAIGASPVASAKDGVTSGEISQKIAPGGRVLVPGPNGLMQSATVRQLLQGYYELEVGGSGETIWVPMNGVVPE